ncbi:MAG: dihydroorotate dehydrogenase electron transfer subunit, partial [Candidatus Aminicenantes bacterium]|nr:dihydroorotate dehydrogenase electron transfer subunit [Candidatus Aminicenantes bacterium]
QKVIIFYGGKTEQDLPLASELKEQGYELLISTEDGSLGFKGLITELLERELVNLKPDRVYACGPEAMLAKMARIIEKWTLKAELSLEARMGCGFGVCYGCVWPIRHNREVHWTRICLEGPVFPAEAIAWEIKND